MSLDEKFAEAAETISKKLNKTMSDEELKEVCHLKYLIHTQSSQILTPAFATIAMFSEHSHLHRNRQTSLKAQSSQSSFGG